MRVLKMTLLVLAMAAAAGSAAAADMALTRAGDLYRLAATDDGLVVTATLADGSTLELTVPQTAGTATSALNLAVDEVNGSVFVLWQQAQNAYARVKLATYRDGVWSGPTLIAGGGDTAAANPQMMIFRAVDDVEAEDENGEPITIRVETSFLHMTWWAYMASVNDGAAVFKPAPIDSETGLVDLNAYDPVLLSDLLPYGIPNCDGIEDATGLTSPMLFSDPQSGFPLLFASDFAECLFYILELDHEVVVDPVTERRRHTIILRQSGTYPVDDRLPLATSSVDIGHGLSFVLYWDADDSVDYMQFDPEGTSDVRSLPIGDHLSHEQAVELIQALTN